MNREALTQLRRVVRDAPEEGWDMSAFSCGTARCAAGWAAQDPWFQEHAPIPMDGYGQGDWSRMGEPFGITEEQSDLLFATQTERSDEVTKEEVIANIDRLLRGEEAVDYDDIEP